MQLTTDITTGFNQRNPPDRLVCHNNLLSKINRSQLPPATSRWVSCYLRGRQAKTYFRAVKYTSRNDNTGVPQGSKLSPSLFVVVSTHSLDPCLWGESAQPAFGPPASISLHLASSTITPAGSVHKSRGDNVVRMWVQLKR